MKFTLDENLDFRASSIWHKAGHDVISAPDLQLGGKPDETIFGACQRDGRCFLTLDLDFSNLLDFPPESSSGIVILRHPHPRLELLHDLVRQLVVALKQHEPTGRLWIIEPGRIRIHGH